MQNSQLDSFIAFLTQSLSRNNTQPLRSTPNPYPLPGSPYSIDFDEAGAWLRRADTINMLVNVRRYYASYILHHRAGEEELKARELQYKNLAFGIAPFAAEEHPRLTWNDALLIVDAFRAKSGSDGAREQWGLIFRREGEVEVGSALLRDWTVGSRDGLTLRPLSPGTKNVTRSM